ncbi:MAG: hypothetical protein OEW06_18370 [Gemmatimonadota bacterium]|nr:hypothetical protein [Gemmatimonadota bacterium]MDH4350765.1 hypothetical protein [Gemmatimonadota bacterium]
MRVLVLLCSAALVVGCAPAEEQPATDMADTQAAVSLADFAGVWAVTAMPETSDSALTTFDLVATDAMDGWSMNPPNREPIPMRVVLVDGDSVVSETGPYASLLRDGVMVTLRSVTRLDGGMLTGTFVAHYATTSADSVVSGRMHGMRKAPGE